MISKELAKKIRYIQIYTSEAVNDVLAGEYENIFIFMPVRNAAGH
jgi:hypothetical protein